MVDISSKFGLDSDIWVADTPIDNTDGSSGSPYAAVSKHILFCDFTAGEIEVALPATGRLQFACSSEPDATNYLRINPPSGESIYNQTADDSLLITARFSRLILSRSGTNWS